jgi:hypothetical protein
MALVVFLCTSRAVTGTASAGMPTAATPRMTATEMRRRAAAPGVTATDMHRCTAAASAADVNTGAASTATRPAVPTRAAAPAQASTEGITAPVPAGALPSIDVPAVAAAAVNVLGLVDHVQTDGRVAEMCRQTSGRRLCGCHGCGADE